MPQSELAFFPPPNPSFVSPSSSAMPSPSISRNNSSFNITIPSPLIHSAHGNDANDTSSTYSMKSIGSNSTATPSTKTNKDKGKGWSMDYFGGEEFI
jgi:hypothetical protein